MGIYDYERVRYRKRKILNTILSFIWSFLCITGLIILGFFVVKFLAPWMKTLFDTVK